ncbi:ABC transporter ATP-binding protein [Deinococcus pimensis]|uniref:ABC transporter ATP-binding protein n=1 Tax=Deinococcus pimensis TaxID=309888 RepID=UPI0005EBAA71|nr:ABC transporter ATP-binding protein [Deinococcus pimensis]
MHRRQYIVGLIAVTIANASILLPAYFLGRAIDALRRAGDGDPSTPGTTLGVVLLYALGVIGGAALSGAAMFVMRRQIVVASRQTEYEVRRDIFAHLQGLDKHYYDRARTGDLMNRLTGDLSAVREMLGFGAWQIASVVTAFGSSLFVMFGISVKLTLLVLAVFPVIILVLYYLARQISKRYVLVQEQNSAISAKAQENFSGARVVKGYAIEHREIAEYKTMNNELIRRLLSLVRVEGPLQAFMSLLMGIAYVLVLLYGGRMILGLVPGETLTVGRFTQYALTLERLAWPMLSIGFIANLTQRGLASWNRLQEMLDARPLVHDTKRTDRSIRTLRGDLRFDHVSLRYGQTTVLHDITLNVPAGITLGITGPTGSGKTSLAQLVARLADPSDGRVLIDGTDVRHIPLKTLRANIGVVPQEPFLFSDSIARNIAFGLDNEGFEPIPTRVSVLSTKVPAASDSPPDMNRVRAAAELAGLARDVEDFPNGYDTMLGERGVTLSGGQRQRTALARAIVREPAILILDDATSAVDTETESRILRGLREVQRGRTVLLIGHRVSTLRHADHIVVLDGGGIVEQGSHDELLERGGHYAELERKQRLAREVDEDTESTPRPSEAEARS